MQARDIRPLTGREVFFRMRSGVRRHGVVERILDTSVVCVAGRRPRRFVVALDDITWMVQCLRPHDIDPLVDEGDSVPRLTGDDYALLRSARIRALPVWRRVLRRLTAP